MNKLPTEKEIADLRQTVEGAPRWAAAFAEDGSYVDQKGVSYDENGAAIHRYSGDRRGLDDARNIIAQHEEIERLRGIVGDALFDNSRFGRIKTETIKAMLEQLEKGESDE